MKKLLIFALAALCSTAQATILRVSNRTNSGAPYSSISDAIRAAEEGDTIMVDGSNTSYGDITITNRVVLIGPGYLLNENGAIAEGSPSAILGGVSSNYNQAAGSIIMGFDIKDMVNLSQPNMVVTRCRLATDLRIATSASNCVVHQNYFVGGRVMCLSTSSTSWAPNAQITNNIFTRKSDDYGVIYRFSDSHIAYNTMVGTTTNINYGQETYLTGCTIENNIFFRINNISGNSYSNNLVLAEGIGEVFADATTDKAVKEISEGRAEEFAGKGAFAGNDPYVISGIPAGPYINDIEMPTSVEKGQTLRVNIKLGVQQ